MKVPVVLLACSLLANAALFVAISRKPAALDLSENKGAEARLDSEASATAAARVQVERLFAIGRTDLALLKGELERAGFPDHLVRAIVRAQSMEEFHARQREYISAFEAPEFWHTGRAFRSFQLTPAQYGELASLSNAYTRRLHEIYPDAFYSDETSLSDARERYGELSPETYTRIALIRMDYDEMMSRVSTEANSFQLGPEAQARINVLEKAQADDIAALLSPEQRIEYEMRSGSSGNALRTALQNFLPSETEFRSIFLAQTELAATRPDAKTGGTTSGSPLMSQDARRDLVARLEGTLPPDRLADLEFALRPEQRNLVALTNRLGLPVQSARDIISLRDAAVRESQRIWHEPDVPADSKAQQANAFTARTEEQLERILGDEGLEIYRGQSGNWLSLINQPPKRETSARR